MPCFIKLFYKLLIFIIINFTIVPMNIFFIGMSGVGKSFWAQKLAQELNMPWIDSDQEIEAQEGITIAEIFEKKGEAYFRNLEHVWSQNISTSSCIISVGGGLPCFYNNMELLKQKGHVVYLKTSPLFLKNRMLSLRQHKPLWKNISEHELLPLLEEQLKTRAFYYSQAHETVDVEKPGCHKKLHQLIRKNTA